MGNEVLCRTLPPPHQPQYPCSRWPLGENYREHRGRPDLTSHSLRSNHISIHAVTVDSGPGENPGAVEVTVRVRLAYVAWLLAVDSPAHYWGVECWWPKSLEGKKRWRRNCWVVVESVSVSFYVALKIINHRKKGKRKKKKKSVDTSFVTLNEISLTYIVRNFGSKFCFSLSLPSV